MPGAYKRHASSRRWTGWYRDETGRRRTFPGFADKRKTERIARDKEEHCTAIRLGLVDPAEVARREAIAVPIAEHVTDWYRDLEARDDTTKHCRESASLVTRLLAEAGVNSLADLTGDRIQAALGRWRDKGRSARTLNKALGAVKSWAKWLDHAGRIAEVPRGLKAIRSVNQEADRRRVRRALSEADLARLLEVAQTSGETVEGVPGTDRAALYRLAMGTGFRANELRSLTIDSFAVEGREPSITVAAGYTKNRKPVVQPITREMAGWLKGWLETRPAPPCPVVTVPHDTAAMLRHDLKTAGIPYRDGSGRVIDFHALRASYITSLIRRGANPKVVQALARHSTIRLTLDTYTSLEESEKRRALEGDGDGAGPGPGPSPEPPSDGTHQPL